MRPNALQSGRTAWSVEGFLVEDRRVNREWLSNLRRLVDTDTSDTVLIRNAFHLGNSGGDDHDVGLKYSADGGDVRRRYPVLFLFRG